MDGNYQTQNTLPPLDILKRNYGEDFSRIRLKDKLLLVTTLMAGLYEFQKRDLRNVYGSFNFWGDSFYNPELEVMLDVCDGQSVFTWFIALEALWPKIKADFQRLAENMQKLMQSGLDEDTAETVGLLLLDEKAGPYFAQERELLNEAFDVIEHNGDPLKILSP